MPRNILIQQRIRFNIFLLACQDAPQLHSNNTSIFVLSVVEDGESGSGDDVEVGPLEEVEVISGELKDSLDTVLCEGSFVYGLYEL